MSWDLVQTRYQRIPQAATKCERLRKLRSFRLCLDFEEALSQSENTLETAKVWPPQNNMNSKLTNKNKQTQLI